MNNSSHVPTSDVSEAVESATSPLVPSGQDDRWIAAASHAVTFFDGGLIIPLIVYVLKKDESPFIAFNALQSAFFTLLFLGLSIVTCGFGAMLLLLPFIVFQIIAAVRAYEGRYYELPIAGRLARRHMS